MSKGLKVRPGQSCIYDIEQKARKEGLNELLAHQRETRAKRITKQVAILIATILAAGGITYYGIQQHRKSQLEQNQSQAEPRTICEKYPESCPENR